jgi:ribose transport system substrate-binding protein
MLGPPIRRRLRQPLLKALSAVLAAGTMALVAACGSGTASGASAKSSKLTIGIVTFSTSDVDTNHMVSAMTAEAASKGWAVQTLNANGSEQQANTQIQQLVTKNVSAVIVTVFDSNSLASGLAAAKAAGIPVLSAGGGLAPGVALATDDGAGQPVVDLMLKNLHNSGTVLDLTYHPGVPCRQRADAFDSIVKNYPDIKATDHEITIPGAAEAAQSATAAWLAANSGKTGNFAIFNCYDDDSMGAIATLKQNHRTGVQVYSYNATPPALAAVKAGTMTATLWLDLKSAGKILVDSIPQIRAQGSAWKPRSVIPKYIIVTKANVASFMATHSAG